MYDIYFDVQINSDPQAVFTAISDPSALIKWWPLRCSGSPKLDEVYNFYFTEEYDWFGVVTKCDLNSSFHIKMTQADKDWNPTTFGFELISNDQGTQLQFSHKDWPELNHHFRRSAFCWALLLQGLKNLVEQGEIIPFEDRA